MYLCPALLAVLAFLLCLAATWYAHDGMRLEAPYSPDACPSDVDAWARDLDASLTPPRRLPCPVMARCVALRLAPDPWTAPPALLMRLGLTHSMRIAARSVPLN